MDAHTTTDVGEPQDDPWGSRRSEDKLEFIQLVIDGWEREGGLTDPA